MSDKIYTLETKPDHPLIKAAVKRGLTSIIITRRKLCYSSEWVLECDQLPCKIIGSDKEEALTRINNLVL
jgi:hypothetical protein